MHIFPTPTTVASSRVGRMSGTKQDLSPLSDSGWVPAGPIVNNRINTPFNKRGKWIVCLIIPQQSKTGRNEIFEP